MIYKMVAKNQLIVDTGMSLFYESKIESIITFKYFELFVSLCIVRV